MIQIYHSSGHHIPYDHLTFSGGEEHIRLKEPKTWGTPKYIKVVAHLRSSRDVMKLVLIVDALARAIDAPRHLVCPYVPYARQDRVCNPGESLGAKLMCEIINSLNFASVEIWDPHSDVVPALLERCHIVPAKEFVHLLPERHDSVFVAPDAGAVKRVLACTAEYGNQMVVAEKIRDTKTGEIIHTSLNCPPIGERDFLIIDDICDGGRTFNELASFLRPLTEGFIYLYVTHGIFSRGLEVFRDNIDHIFTPNSWLPADPTIMTILNPGDRK